MTGKVASILAFLLTMSSAARGHAEHEVYYRYVVLGYVRDGSGLERAGVQIELVRDKTGFSYLGETDVTGLYVIVARLGDESAGERLTLRAASEPISIVVRFDPKDHTRDRGTRVDFLGKRSVETPAAFAATLREFLAR